MAQLAIKGHATRGREVIELLEMLGGENLYVGMGNAENLLYFTQNNVIQFWTKDDLNLNNFIIFTLEEFLEKFPYKVGDKVVVTAGRDTFIDVIGTMKWKEKINTILYVPQNIKINVYPERLQFYKEKTMEEKADTSMAPILQSEDYSGRRFGYKIPKGYEFDCIKENEIIIKPIKPQYPKTYEECCKIKHSDPNFYIDTHLYSNQLESLYKLLICRDTYWKIAGEQMGLGKPWLPNWAKADEMKYCIVNTEGNITKWVQKTTNKILAFPTEKMRDTFFENFKILIELVKELL